MKSEATGPARPFPSGQLRGFGRRAIDTPKGGVGAPEGCCDPRESGVDTSEVWVDARGLRGRSCVWWGVTFSGRVVHPVGPAPHVGDRVLRARAQVGADGAAPILPPELRL